MYIIYVHLSYILINLTLRYGKFQWTIENLQIKFKLYIVLTYDINVDWKFNQISLVSVYIR